MEYCKECKGLLRGALMTPRKLPQVLNQAEVQQILGVIRHKRDRALFQLMFDAGMRVSEVCGLITAQIDLGLGILKVRGKGRNERMIPFTDTASMLCKEYAQTKTETVYFFSNEDGGQLSRQYVWQLCKRYAKLAGISKRVSPHVFRHSKATALLNAGMDLRYLQEFLGHENVDTTQIYTHVSRTRLVQVHQQCHPRA